MLITPLSESHFILILHMGSSLDEGVAVTCWVTEMQWGGGWGRKGQLGRVRGWEVRQLSAEVSVLIPQTRADKQSHIMWALTGHVQRQRREMAAQEHRLRQIQER